MLYYLLVQILKPFLILLLMVTIASLLLWRKRIESRRRLLRLTVPLVLLYLFCTPVVSFLAAGTLEWRYPPTHANQDAQAIVVLGGGIRPPDEVRKIARLDNDTLQRCIQGAELYLSGPRRKVVVTGGKVDPTREGPTLAEAMKQFMLQLGVAEDDMLVEAQSRSTYENARFSADLLKDHEIDRVILVTDATHLYRALLCFRAQNISATPSGVRYRATQLRWSIFSFLPSSGAARLNQDVFHEWLGLTWYWLKGRI